MGRFDGVLLTSDFDNTLIYTEESLLRGEPIPPLPERNRQALDYFLAEGGRFTVATGRALAAFEKYAPLVPMNAPAVICNGAVLYDFARGEYLENILLDDQARRRGQIILDRFPQAAAEAYHIDNVIHAVHPNAITRQHEHITGVAVTEVPSLPEVPLPLGKLLFEEEHEKLEEVRGFLEAQGWSGDYEIIYSGRTLLEVTARGANKGGMIRRLADRLGISMDHVYCVGDETNDISMLTAAARGFAPDNCVDAVRACGATIVSHAEHDALADVVEILEGLYR